MEDVWIADDEASYRKLLRTLVTRAVHPTAVREFPSAEAVVVALEKDYPKLLITDNTMEKMQGIDLIRYIRALSDERKAMRIIFCTANDELARDAEKLGVKYVAKPPRIADMEQVIKDWYPT